MKRHDHFQSLRRWLLVFALTGACLNGIALAELDEEDVVEPAAGATITLAPADEAKLTELVKKIGEAKHTLLQERMKKEIEAVAQATGLNDEGKKALEPAGEAANVQSLADWNKKVEEQIRTILTRQGGIVPGPFLAQALPNAAAWAKAGFGVDYLSPTEQPAWLDALKKTLTPEQVAAWDKVVAERRRVFDEQIADYMKNVGDRFREQQERAILPKAEEISRILSLPQERAEKLNALAKAAAAKSVETIQESQRKMLLSMDDDTRRQMLPQRGVFFGGPAKKDLPERQAVWKEGLAQLLSADELKLFREAQGRRAAGYTEAMGRLMVVLLDAKVAFTETQRLQLQPIAERLAKEHMGAILENQSPFGGLSPIPFFAAAAKAPEGEIKPLLDATQWSRWKDACVKGQTSAMNQRQGRDVPPAPQPPATSPEPEPEERERAISDFLQAKTQERRQRLFAVSILKAEDAARVAHLPPAAVARLEVAARGEAEEALDQWRSNIEQNIRMNFLQDATARNIQQRLAGIEDYVFGDQYFGGFRYRNGRREETLWERAVQTELTEEQRAAWKVELDARDAYREKAITSILMMAFDRRQSLAPAQREKIEPLIAGILKEYGPDISSCFSSSNEIPWYMQFYSAFFPFAGIPEADFKAILTKDQWERWLACEEHSNAASFWSNIQQNHAQRERMKKEQEEREKREKERREKQK